ncbi:MAG: Rpn family recombination-promoting nuclease/putative transposase [Candidatus Pedobacter colombiensis]|uniref:Rpn family recombination-promoting nuclease/putative transposase n=1 Tax=Candidatus Pedobacter colombiensis TaxID=3121371 RepID=A0AAJ5WAT9_9SPHI|nr:Rpn family recombination-promoting nuclease/putative transposase [Pedobacter sp.]WEK21172.1 MAG: Rpn family recombination-promoting nuclease/putative transposase [Pedobacter sp.]
MSEETDSTRLIDSLNKDKFPRFIDPYSDFGFKHIFGKAPNKSFLISFLNQVLKGRKVIIDIQYNDTQYKGSGSAYRKTVFDLYCTGDKGEQFIVEMQKAKVKNFKDRSIFYTSNLIQEQGVGVIANWDYMIPEIYFVAIMNFKFDDSHPDHFIHDVRLMEINTNREFYPKLAYIFIETPKFKKLEEELENELEEWLYILNNLKELSEIPLSLIGKGEYDKVFEIAEVGNLTPEEMNEYQQRLKIHRDNYNAMEYVKDEGRQEGREEGCREVALKLKAVNISLSIISETTGLTIEQIESL